MIEKWDAAAEKVDELADAQVQRTSAPIQSMRPRRQALPRDGQAHSEAGGPGFVTPEPGTRVFDPNSDNTLLMHGDAASAGGIWLLNWREIGLDMAKETGGWCVQV